MREHCGLIGIYNHQEAARMAYFGLYAQQHRGQESAGIAAWDGKEIREQRALGLVADNFNETDLAKTLAGDIAIGHVNSRARGKPMLRDAEPFVIKHRGLCLAAAHNGELINSPQLRERLENEGAIFRSSTDSEVFLHLIVRKLNKMSIEEAVLAAGNEMKGAFCFLLMVQDKLMALRDTHGMKPLALGKVGDSPVLASETCAFDLLEADYIRDVEPGELLVIEGSKISSFKLEEKADPNGRPRAHCIFELVYFARPDSSVFGQNVYLSRKIMGQQLALEQPVEGDLVMPFPDSGVYSAVGFAQASGLPYEHAMIRNHYVGRTFIQPTQSMRDFSVRVKINPVREVIRNKRIVIVDDSIVRGTTMSTRVKKLRELGAREVHCRISSPQVIRPCRYGVDFATRGELIASNHSLEEIRRFLGLDTLGHISIEGMKKSVSNPQDYCSACFDGKYPINLE